ncbi:MAG: hypothetical protein ACK559_05865, partial [bacterium]
PEAAARRAGAARAAPTRGGRGGTPRRTELPGGRDPPARPGAGRGPAAAHPNLGLRAGAGSAAEALLVPGDLFEEGVHVGVGHLFDGVGEGALDEVHDAAVDQAAVLGLGLALEVGEGGGRRKAALGRGFEAVEQREVGDGGAVEQELDAGLAGAGALRAVQGAGDAGEHVCADFELVKGLFGAHGRRGEGDG